MGSYKKNLGYKRIKVPVTLYCHYIIIIFFFYKITKFTYNLTGLLLSTVNK